MVAEAETDLKGLRDRAILLLGFAGAFRRSELVALDASNLHFASAGLRVTVRKSKTDQEGQGATIAIPRVARSPALSLRCAPGSGQLISPTAHYSALLRGWKRFLRAGYLPEQPQSL